MSVPEVQFDGASVTSAISPCTVTDFEGSAMRKKEPLDSERYARMRDFSSSAQREVELTAQREVEKSSTSLN